MKNINKLFAILFAVLGVQTLAATDYIIGADGFTVNKIVVSNDATNGCAREFWSSSVDFSFDIYQETELPNGVYTFQLQSMYRAHLTRNSITNVALYANTSGNQYIGRVLNYTEGSVSSESLSAFNTAFSNDATNYLAKIPYFIVTDGKAKVGVRTLSKTPYCNNGHWFIYNPSSFKLSSVEDTEVLTTALNDVKHQADGLLKNSDTSDEKTALQNAYNSAEATSESIIALKNAVDTYLAYLSTNATTETPNDVSYYFMNPKFDGSVLRTVGAVNVYNNGGQPFGWVCYEEAGTGTANQGNALAENMGFNHFTVVDNSTTYDGQVPGYSEATTGNSLYNRFAWAQWSSSTFSTKQSVTLPSGSYKLSIPAYVSENSTNYDGQIIFTINGETSTQSLTANTWKVYETEFILAEQSEISVDLQFRKILASANAGKAYAYFDGVTLLSYGDPIAALLKEINEKLTTLKTYQEIIPTSMYASFNENLTAAENANNTQSESDLQSILDALNTNIAAADKAVSPYASLNQFITLCSGYAQNSSAYEETYLTDFNSAISTANTAKDKATSVDEINTAYNTLETARQTYVVNADPTNNTYFDYTFKVTNAAVVNGDGWSGARTNSGEQYTGAPDNTYWDSWNGSGQNIYQEVANLPSGLYTLKAAGRASTSCTSAYIYLNDTKAEIDKAGNSGNDLGNGWKWYTTEKTAVAGTATIGFGCNTANKQWAGADDFHLYYYGFDVTTAQNSVATLKAEAETLVDKNMNAYVKTTLNNAISGADATKTTRNELNTMIEALNTAIADAKTSIADYEKIAAYIAKAKVFDASLVTEYEKKYNNGEYTANDVENVFQALEVSIYQHVTDNFKYDVELTADGWISEGPVGSLEGQHYDGTTTSSYLEQSTDAYAQSAWEISYKYEKTLPAGKYIFKVAGRHAAGTGVTMTMTVNNINDSENPVELGSVNDFPGGDTGLGINKNGVTSFDANDEAGFANDNKGRGWQWRYVQFELGATTTVQIAVNAVATTSKQWMSFCDATLKMDETTYLNANKEALDAPMAAAEALVNSTPMGTTEKTELEKAINLSVTTGAELKAKIEALKTAVANANAWVATYNTEKANLVAALERFEADYNDAENGALAHMNKSRWTTVIEKAGAAALAKDNQTDYTVLTAATTDLVNALNAADVSIAEYAALKTAIDDADALVKNDINWGNDVFQRPESAKESLNTTHAQAVYDAQEADGDAVTAAATALAEDSITLNAPEADEVFYITVASEGHEIEGNYVVASLGTTSENNPTGYGFNANTTTTNYAQKAFRFEQVESNLYHISVLVNDERVYLTYGALNESAAGHKNGQIQGNINKEKAGTFKIEASPAVEGAFRIVNTITNTYVNCQKTVEGNHGAGSIYTDGDEKLADFALAKTDDTESSVAIKISAENMWSTCVLPFNATLPSGLRAFKSNELSETGLLLAEVEGSLEAYTPYILFADTTGFEGTLTGTVDLTDYEDYVTDGIALYGAIEKQTINVGYVLQNKGNGVKFYKIAEDSDVTIPVHKCWLEVSNSSISALQQSVPLKFEEGITGIKGVELDTEVMFNAADGIYTIDGKRVEEMENGKIYIVGGKKVLYIEKK